MKLMKYLGKHWKLPVYVSLVGAVAFVPTELSKPRIYDSGIKESRQTEMILEDLQFSPAWQEDEMIFFNFKKDGNFDRISVRTKAGEFCGKPGEGFEVGLSREEYFDYYLNHIRFSIDIREEKSYNGQYSILSEYKGVIK